MTNKIVLGTAQFGMNYGVSNKQGKPSLNIIRKILNFAESNGIKSIDTAPVYGNSEESLGKNNLDSFKLITKTLPFSCIKSEEVNLTYLSKSLSQSLENLGVNRLHGLLVHHAGDLLHKKSKILYDWLIKQKELGLVEKIGVSVYSEKEINQLTQTYKFDIIQAPVNIIDQRLIHSGSLNKLSNLGVEIHCRSVFLQGLLLMNFSQMPSYFYQYKSVFDDFKYMTKECQKSALELSLGYLMSIPEIDKIIVGVNNVENLDQIVKASCTTVDYESMSSLACDDIGLVDPNQWN